MKLFDVRRNRLLLKSTILLNCPHAFNFSFSFPALHQSLNQFELHLIYNSNILPFYLFHVYYVKPLEQVDLMYKQSNKLNKNSKLLKCQNIKSTMLKTLSNGDSEKNDCLESESLKKSLVIGNDNLSLKMSSIRIISAWSCLFYFIIFFIFLLLCILLLTLIIKSYITKKFTMHKSCKTNDTHSPKLLFQNCNKLTPCKHAQTHSIVSKNSKIVFVCSSYFFLFVRIFILLSLTYTLGFFLFYVHIQPEISEYFQSMASIFSISATQLTDQLTVINSQALISSHMNDNFIKSFHAFYLQKYKSIYIFFKRKIHEIYSSIDINSKRNYFMHNFHKFHIAYESDLNRFTHVFKERYINDTHMHFLNYALYSKLLQKSVWLGKAESLCRLANSQTLLSRLSDCMGIQESSRILYNRRNLFKK